MGRKPEEIHPFWSPMVVREVSVLGVRGDEMVLSNGLRIRRQQACIFRVHFICAQKVSDNSLYALLYSLYTCNLPVLPP